MRYTALCMFGSTTIGASTRLMRLITGKLVLLLGAMSLIMPNAANATTILTGEDRQTLCDDPNRFPERLQGLAVEEVLLAYEERWPSKN